MLRADMTESQLLRVEVSELQEVVAKLQRQETCQTHYGNRNEENRTIFLMKALEFERDLGHAIAAAERMRAYVETGKDPERVDTKDRA